MEQVKHLIHTIRDLSQRHRALATLCYTALALLLVGALALAGALPWQAARHDGPAPAASHTTRPEPRHKAKDKPKPRKEETAPTPPAPAPRDPAQVAGGYARDMSNLLGTDAGVNNNTIGEIVSMQEDDPDSPYSQAEQRLTDLIKTVQAGPADPTQARSQCDQLDQAWSQWNTELWKAANDTLGDQVRQMEDGAAPGQNFIAGHPDYPQPCRAWAADRIEDWKGTTEDDFHSLVAHVKQINTELDQCGTQMTQEQAAAMPQDAA